MKILRLCLLGVLILFVSIGALVDCNDTEKLDPPSENLAPVAIINTVPNKDSNDKISGMGPLTVFFNASQSYDPEEGQCPNCKIVKYEWDLNGDGMYETVGVTATHTFPASTQDYNVQLRVTDNYEQTGTAIVTVKSKSAPLAPYVKGVVRDPQGNPLTGKTVVAIPEDADFASYITSGIYDYSFVSTVDGKYAIQQLQFNTTYYLLSGFADYSDNWVMTAEIDSYHTDMDWDEVVEATEFPMIYVDNNGNVTPDSLDIILHKGINLLDAQGNDWQQNALNPVDITIPYTFKWEYINHPPLGGYWISVANLDTETSIWYYPEEYVPPNYVPFVDSEKLCNANLTPGAYKFVVVGLLFDPNVVSGGQIIYSEFLDGDFEITE